MTNNLEIKFRRFTGIELAKGGLITFLFTLPVFIAGILLYLLLRRLGFQASLSAGGGVALLIYLTWLFADTLYGWIWRTISNQNAATLNSNGITSWTSTGQQSILWKEIAEIAVQRPIAIDPNAFLGITILGKKNHVGESFSPKIILSSDIMQFDVSDVMKFMKDKRPELIS